MTLCEGTRDGTLDKMRARERWSGEDEVRERKTVRSA